MKLTALEKLLLVATVAAVVTMAGATSLEALEINKAADTADKDQAPPQFASVIDDLPLPEGMKPIDSDEDVLFVVPRQGRIADTSAAGKVDVDEVYHFYQRSLPQLGWQQVDNQTYQRENETLHIEAHAENDITKVHFEVEPNQTMGSAYKAPVQTHIQTSGPSSNPAPVQQYNLDTPGGKPSSGTVNP